MAIAPNEGRRLSEQVVDYITQLIASGEYTAGDKLPSERDLASELGVSRPLVRESYRILEALGVVEVRHGIGALVADHSPQTVGIARFLWEHAAESVEVLEIRDVLAARCGELAAQRITDDELTNLEEIYDEQRIAIVDVDPDKLVQIDCDFHDSIYQATHNQVLIAMENYTRDILGNHRMITLVSRPEESSTEHAMILAALKDRDSQAAGSAMRLHALRSNAAILRLLEQRTTTVFVSPVGVGKGSGDGR